METIIMKTIFTDGQTIESNLPSAVFLSGSGVKTLLQRDPTSRVIIEKEDGTIISYRYKNPQS